jgi:uncharacterized protein YdeI (YjbR/CyaY-like superfamily)
VKVEVGQTLDVRDRSKWREWLAKNYASKSEIWLINYKKHTGKPSVPYNDAVEEALCFGWIDSIVKRIDDDRTAQRYTPRREKSNLSETNRERVLRLIDQGKMTEAGLSKIRSQLDEDFKIAPDILRALKRDKAAWKNFQDFTDSYKRIRVGWIEGARGRPEVFETRLNYFIKMTSKNKTYGMVQ